LVEVGTDQLLRVLAAGLGAATPQTGEITMAAKLEPHEFQLDWTKPAEELDRVVRLGRAWTTWRGRRLRVLEAEVVVAPGEPGQLLDLVVTCGRGGLRLVTVQPEGKAAMAASAWANGSRPEPGERIDG
jgi:methionyl-tRNA formyltransferase